MVHSNTRWLTIHVRDNLDIPVRRLCLCWCRALHRLTVLTVSPPCTVTVWCDSNTSPVTCHESRDSSCHNTPPSDARAKEQSDHLALPTALDQKVPLSRRFLFLLSEHITAVDITWLSVVSCLNSYYRSTFEKVQYIGSIKKILEGKAGVKKPTIVFLKRGS